MLGNENMEYGGKDIEMLFLRGNVWIAWECWWGFRLNIKYPTVSSCVKFAGYLCGMIHKILKFNESTNFWEHSEVSKSCVRLAYVFTYFRKYETHTYDICTYAQYWRRLINESDRMRFWQRNCMIRKWYLSLLNILKGFIILYEMTLLKHNFHTSKLSRCPINYTLWLVVS